MDAATAGGGFGLGMWWSRWLLGLGCLSFLLSCFLFFFSVFVWSFTLLLHHLTHPRLPTIPSLFVLVACPPRIHHHKPRQRSSCVFFSAYRRPTETTYLLPACLPVCLDVCLSAGLSAPMVGPSPRDGFVCPAPPPPACAELLMLGTFSWLE